MSRRPAWHNLKTKFLRLVKGLRSGHNDQWENIWRVIVSDPWYQHKLTVCAAKCLSRHGKSGDWLEDVKQEAMLLLARQLAVSPDLHVDIQRAEEHFDPWMRQIIYHHCQEAVRYLGRLYREAQVLPGYDAAYLRDFTIEARVDCQ
jgi:hypothetical protein